MRSLPRSLATSKATSGAPAVGALDGGTAARAIDTRVMSSSCSHAGPVNSSRSASTAPITSASGAVRPMSARSRGNP